MNNIITRNIGENREKRRVWIEGKSLESGGWLTGHRYQREEITGGFKLTKIENGKLKIAGKPGRPIIDLCGGYVAKALVGYEKVTVTIEPNSIIIKGASAVAALATLAA